MKFFSNPHKMMKMTTSGSQKYMDIHKKINPVCTDKTSLEEALANKVVAKMSFLTSCSNNFQKRNMNKTLNQTKEELDKMFDVLKKREHMNIKKTLHVCCITECPIDGKIDMDYILHEILMYDAKYELDEINLLDICGSLMHEECKYIVDALIYFGVLRTKIGITLKLDANDRNETNQIIHYSLNNKIKCVMNDFSKFASLKCKDNDNVLDFSLVRMS